jgi:hypothetical protein
MRAPPHTTLFLVLSVSACATTSGSEEGPRRDRNLITLEEIQDLPSVSAYEAIQRLRPAWLQSRGPMSGGAASRSYPSVYMDGISMGGMDILRDLRVEHVHEMRFIQARDATTRFGTGHLAGVIEVISRK